MTNCQKYFREWISPSTCSYIAREMVENSAEYKNLLETFDVYIMPSMNPDGYEFSRTKDRMWRKTRSVNPGFKCKGTDPNRNWGYNWGLVGSSSNPCDGKEKLRYKVLVTLNFPSFIADRYRGTSAFSEPETSAVGSFILKRSEEIQLYLTFHSYGQMVLYPWAYDRLEHSQEEELGRLGRVGAEAMGRGYTVGTVAKVSIVFTWVQNRNIAN